MPICPLATLATLTIFAAVSAQAAGPACQAASAAVAPTVYTPQVIADGRDWRTWPQLPDAESAAGQTLRHDHVVRLYKPLPPWSSASSQRAQLSVSRGVAETPRRVVFVVTDAATHRPLQALALAC